MAQTGGIADDRSETGTAETVDAYCGRHMVDPQPQPDNAPNQAPNQVARRQMRRQALSIALALIPFGIVFGVASAEAGLTLAEAIGFSALVFTGGSQFAAVETLGNGGAVAAAVSAGLLLSLRSLAYGVIMAPALAGPLWRRAVESQLMIDEAVAVGTTQTNPGLRRFGYRWGGGSVFVGWNAMTVLGFVAFSSAGDLVRDLGLDAAIPASFLALLWPRLSEATARAVAVTGAIVAAVLLPLTPPGVPILAAGVGVVVARNWRGAVDDSGPGTEKTATEQTGGDDDV